MVRAAARGSGPGLIAMVRAGEPDGYCETDTARRFAEESKLTNRSAFTRDRARVLHSWALRRLADKTQVLFPGNIGLSLEHVDAHP